MVLSDEYIRFWLKKLYKATELMNEFPKKWWTKSALTGYIPHEPFVHGYIGQWMPYTAGNTSNVAHTLCRWKFSHNKTLQQTFFERSTLWEEKMVNLRFWVPFGVRSNMRCSSWAHWNARSRLPILVIIELFFTRCFRFVTVHARVWEMLIGKIALYAMQRGKNRLRFNEVIVTIG